MNVSIFKALGNEARLQIIQTLMIKEHNVTDLTTISKKDQTTVSRHLTTLTNAGIIDQKRVGRNIFYRIISTEMKKWLEACIDTKEKDTEESKLRNKIQEFLNNQRT
tara:strand:+ start:1047 stop:1367 length:321 start_codon:yes stop_codon:yes gene_type:complete